MNEIYANGKVDFGFWLLPQRGMWRLVSFKLFSMASGFGDQTIKKNFEYIVQTLQHRKFEGTFS